MPRPFLLRPSLALTLFPPMPFPISTTCLVPHPPLPQFLPVSWPNSSICRIPYVSIPVFLPQFILISFLNSLVSSSPILLFFLPLFFPTSPSFPYSSPILTLFLPHPSSILPPSFAYSSPISSPLPPPSLPHSSSSFPSPTPTPTPTADIGDTGNSGRPPPFHGRPITLVPKPGSRLFV